MTREKPLRILHVTSLYFPDQVGGAEVCVRDLAEGAAAAGHAVAVVASSREPAGRALEKGVEVHRVGHASPFFVKDWADQSAGRKLLYKARMQLSAELPRRIAAVAAEFRPDVVNTHSLSELPPAVWRELSRLPARLVHTLHDYTSLCTNGAMFRNDRACSGQHAKCRVYSAAHRIHQGGVEGVVGVGRSVLDAHLAAGMFRQVPPALRRVIWNPIPAPAAPAPRPARQEPGITFGYLGRIERSKGVHTLLEACRRLPPDGWRLVVAGRSAGPLEPFREMAAGLPVEFVGFVDPDAFLAGIDCLVVPPIWAEAFGRTVAEAYLHGVPVIGSATGGIAEQIGGDDPAFLFEPGDAAALADRMLAVIRGPGRPSVDPRRLAAVRAGVDPAAVLAAYLDLYRDLIAARRAA